MRVSKDGDILDIKPPIILDAHTAKSVQPLKDFINMLADTSNAKIVRAESLRLKPYLVSMSRHLRKALQAISDDGDLAPQKEDLKKLTTPAALKKTFNDMAGVTHATILSEVALLPMAIANNPAVEGLFSGREFSRRYYFGTGSFDFGFMQVLRQDSSGANLHSITFPIFGIKDSMLTAIRPYAPEVLMSTFRDVMTYVNHDMLHHFTLPYIGGNTAGKANPDKSLANLVKTWAKTLHRGSFNTEAYEDWAQVGHEKILGGSAHTKQTQEMLKKLDDYFHELGRIGREIISAPAILYTGEQKENLPEHIKEIVSDPDLDKAARKKKANEVVNFYSMMMAHALIRVFPLNHAIMNHCLDLMQKTDLDPNIAKLTRLAIGRETDDGHVSRRPLSDKAWKKKRNEYLHAIKSSSKQAIVAGYESAGFPLLPEKSEDVTYKQLKLLQLIELSPTDINPHIPSPHRDDDMRYVRRKNDEATLRMVLAAAGYIAANEKEESAVLSKLIEEQAKQEKSARVTDPAVVKLPAIVR